MACITLCLLCHWSSESWARDMERWLYRKGNTFQEKASHRDGISCSDFNKHVSNETMDLGAFFDTSTSELWHVAGIKSVRSGVHGLWGLLVTVGQQSMKNACDGRLDKLRCSVAVHAKFLVLSSQTWPFSIIRKGLSGRWVGHHRPGGHQWVLLTSAFCSPHFQDPLGRQRVSGVIPCWGDETLRQVLEDFSWVIIFKFYNYSWWEFCCRWFSLYFYLEEFGCELGLVC